MNLDLFVFLGVAFAAFRGYQKGLLMALFSVAGIVLGALVAFKFTTTIITQPWMEPYRDTPWLSLLVFAILVSLTVLIVNLIGRLIQKTIEFAMLGWANRLGGIVLYVLLNLFVLSCFITLAGNVSEDWQRSMEKSSTYRYVKPIAPAVLNFAGMVSPWIKSSLKDLEELMDKPLPPIETKTV